MGIRAFSELYSKKTLKASTKLGIVEAEKRGSSPARNLENIVVKSIELKKM